MLAFFKENNRIRFTLIDLVFFLLPALLMLSLSGCGENENIIPASRLTSGQVTLTWNDVPEAIAYNVHLSTTPGVTTLNALKIPNVTSPITISDLEPGTTYYFIVVVVDSSGRSEKSKEIAYSATTSPGNIHFNDLVKPLPPEKPPATAKGAAVSAGAVKSKNLQKRLKPNQQTPTVASGKVKLAWDNVSNATYYNIYWSNKRGVTKRNGTKISNVKNPHTITGLKKGTTYYLVVTAVNESGESSASSEISFTVDE